jgi:hypothetical protein
MADAEFREYQAELAKDRRIAEEAEWKWSARERAQKAESRVAELEAERDEWMERSRADAIDRMRSERDRLRAALTRTGDGWHCCLPGSVVVTPDDKCVVLTADEAEQIKGAIRNLLVPWMEEAAGPLDAISADCANAEQALALLGEEKS